MIVASRQLDCKNKSNVTGIFLHSLAIEYHAECHNPICPPFSEVNMR